MTRSQRIHTLLAEAFAPSALEIIDDSDKHAGHAGAQPGGETHYTVKISSAKFSGLSRVAMQRAVMSALQSEFDSGLHALSIKAKTA
jgi:BolA family transcriptional regulator, general stress-responsive regulator